MNTNDNEKIVDLNKVQWASLHYKNDKGNILGGKPPRNTVHGIAFDDTAFAYPHVEYPLETCLERAKRLEILDVWTPVLVLQVQCNRTIRYTGPKAISVWKAWRAKVFGESNI